MNHSLIPDLTSVTNNQYISLGVKDTTLFIQDTVSDLIDQNRHIHSTDDLNQVVIDEMEQGVPREIIKTRLMSRSYSGFSE